MNIVWTGAADSNWGNAANWNPQQVPGLGDTATFPAGIYTVNTEGYNTVVVDGVTLGDGVTLSVVDTGGLQLGGTAENSGAISVDQGDSAALLIGTSDKAAVTLDGGGSILLGGAGVIGDGVAGASLDNIDNTIEGSGTIQGGFALTNEAGGLIDANSASGGQLDLYGTGITNDGTIEASGNGRMSLNYGAVVDQSAGGSILADGANVTLVGATVQGGTLDSSGGAAIFAGRSSNGQPLLDGTVPGGLANLGSFVVDDSSVVSLAGSIHNQGSFTANQGDSAQILIGGTPGADVVLDGLGSVELGGAGQIAAGVSGASLDNIDNTIEGSGQIGGGLSLTNEIAGTIDGNAGNGASLNLYGDAIANAGLIEASGSGTMTLNYGTTLDQASSGTLDADGAPVTLVGATVQGGTLDSSGSGAIFAGRANNAQPLLDGTVPSGLTNLGSFVVDDSSVVSLAGTIDNQGSFTANQGDSAQILIGGKPGADVVLDGFGSINLGGAGEIAPGATGASLYNLDNTIEGSGTIEGGIDLFNERSGTIDANAAGGAALNLYGTQIANTGLIEASGSGGLVLNYGVVVDQTAHGLIVPAVLAISAGTIDADGANVLMIGATVEGGTLESSGGAAIYAGRANNVLPLLDGTVAGGLTNLSSFIVDDASVVTLAGAIHNRGSITADQGDSAQILIGGTPGAAVTLDGGGSVTLGQLGQIAAGVGGAALTNVNNTIQGSGTIEGGIALRNQSAGLIDADAANHAALDIYGTALTNTGTVEASDGGVLNINYGAKVLNSGTLGAAPGGTANLDVPIINNGVLMADGGWLVENDGIAGAGAIQIRDGGVAVLNTASGMNVSFRGAGGTLLLPDAYSGIISGFAAGDAIDLPNQPLNPGNPNFAPPELSLPGQPYTSYWGGGNGLPNNYLSIGYVPNSGGTGGVLTVYEHAIYSWIDANDDNNYAGSAYSVFPVWSVQLSGSYSANGFSSSGADGGISIGYFGGSLAYSWATPISGSWQTAADWTGGSVPQGGGIVTLGLSGAYTVTDSAAATAVARLNITDTAATLAVAGGAAFVANSGTIGGAVQVAAGGSFSVLGDLLLNATGSVSAQGAGAQIVLDGALVTGAGVFSLGGGALLEAAGAGTGSTIGGRIGVTDGSSLEAVAGSTLTLAGVVVDAVGGTVEALGGTLLLSGAAIDYGTLVNSGGTIATVAASNSKLAGSTLSAGSVLTVADASTLTLQGSIDAAGTLQLLGAVGDALALTGHVTLGGGGSLTLDDSAANAILASSAGAELIDAGVSLTGAGSIGAGDGWLSLVNQAGALIEATGTNPLIVNTGNTVSNSGILAAAAGSQLTVNDALTSHGTLQAGGSIDLAGTADTLSGSIAGAGLLTASGMVQISAGLTDSAAQTEFLGGFNNAGTVTAAGGTLFVASGATGTGAYRIDAGSELQFGGSAAAGSIAFIGSGGTLGLVAGSMPQATLKGFAIGDTIDITGLATADIIGKSFVNNALTIDIVGGGSEVLTFASAFALKDFTFQTDASNTGIAVGYHA